MMTNTTGATMANGKPLNELRRLWDATEPAADECDIAGQAKKANGPAASRRTADRFATLNGFVDFTAGTLNRAALLVWLVLYRDTRDGTAATSQTDIARRTGLCRRTVVSALQRLEAAGLLKRVYRGGLRRGTSRYRVFGLRTDADKVQ